MRSGIRRKSCIGAGRRELERYRGRKEANLSNVSRATCFAREAYEKFTRSTGKRNQTKKNVRNVPNCGVGFFPLDEKLELQPGSLTPRQLSHLAHFASVVFI